VRNVGRRPAKLDSNASAGIFLGFTATSKNVYYFDTTTNRVKTGTHVMFDEAGYTIPLKNQTLLQQRLQQSGVQSIDIDHEQPHTSHLTATSIDDDTSQAILFKRLSDNATIPQRATAEAAGYDIHSATDTVISPRTTTKVSTDLAVCPPINTYCQLLSRSGLVTRHGIEVKAGTIDRDYTGNIMVELSNTSDHPFIIRRGDCIAQLIVHPIAHPKTQEVEYIPSTDRGSQGFGSTGLTGAQIKHIQEVNAATASDVHTIDRPYNVWLSQHPFHHLMDITIPLMGTDPMLGMRFSPTFIRTVFS